MKKYEYLQLSIKKKIESEEYPKDTLLPSEAKLMELYKVSRNVVRQALKNLEQLRFTRTMKGVGTFVNEIPTSTSSPSAIIGLITFFSHSYIFPDIIEGIDKILHPKGYHLLIGYSHHSKHREKALLEQFITKGVAGIIIEAIGNGSIESSNYLTLKELEKSGIPIIFIDNKIPHTNYTSINLNDYESGAKSASYLIQKGHTNLAIFYQKDYFPKSERMRGMSEYISRFYPDFSLNVFPFTGQGGLSTAQSIAKEMIDTITTDHIAIFCSSDEDAQVVIEEAKKKNLIVGKDFSIIGFDNFASLGITSFTHPSIHMGKIAAREMLDSIQDKDEAITITLSASFVERDSVKNLLEY